jgi:membrane protease YdiL (CAAX protease family)
MESGTSEMNQRSQTRRAVAALLLSLVLSLLYMLFRNWMTGGWLRMHPGWISIGRAWILHLGAFLILGVAPFLLQRTGWLPSRLKPPWQPDDPVGKRIRSVWAAYPLWMKLTALVIAAAIGINSNSDPCLSSTYPIPDGAPWNLLRYLAFMPSYLLYYLAFEFHYRGFLLPTLGDRFGSKSSLLLHAITPTILHIGLCPTELIGSFPGQVAMGWIALRGGSIWPALILHAIVGLSLDISVLFT